MHDGISNQSTTSQGKEELDKNIEECVRAAPLQSDNNEGSNEPNEGNSQSTQESKSPNLWHSQISCSMVIVVVIVVIMVMVVLSYGTECK